MKTVYTSIWSFLAAVIILLGSLSAQAETPVLPRVHSTVDKIVQKYIAKKEFSGVVLVQDKGNIIHFRSYGLAVREHGVRNDLDSIFRVGSLSKQFVAALVLQLQEKDPSKLSVDDPIEKFISAPPSWKGIRIRHLLSHTSGLPAEIPIAISHVEAFHAPEALLESALTVKPVRPEEPGKHFLYSNMGYSLLAMVIAKVTGIPYQGYFDKIIGQDLHLATQRISHDAFIVPKMAFGYQRISEEIDIRSCCTDMINLLGAGDVQSSAIDLSRWLDVLLSQKFVRSETLAEMWSPQATMESEDGTPIDGLSYGYGWTIDNRRGRLVISHNGSVPGYVADLAWLPRKQARIIVLSNLRNLKKIGDKLEPEDTASLIRFEIADALYKE